MKAKAVLITGVTAAGKTALAHVLYQQGDMLINADSRQVYRHLNIGTSKPTAQEISFYHYQLIDFLTPGQRFSVYNFLQQTQSLLAHQSHNTKTAQRTFIVGGPSLYVHSLFNGLPLDATSSHSTEQVTHELEEQYQRSGLDSLLMELKDKDKKYYNQVDKKNSRRVIRALIVIRSLNISYTDYRKKQTPPPIDLLTLVISPSRKEFYSRIEKRVNAMFEDGLLIEVQNLLALGYIKEQLLGIGYHECIDFLEQKISLEECKNLIITHTRQFAKRQINWLKSFKKGLFFSNSGSPNNDILDTWLKNMPSVTFKNAIEVVSLFKQENCFYLKLCEIQHLKEIVEHFYAKK